MRVKVILNIFYEVTESFGIPYKIFGVYVFSDELVNLKNPRPVQPSRLLQAAAAAAPSLEGIKNLPDGEQIKLLSISLSRCLKGG